MVVLARWCVCLSSEVREEFMSSSDSCSRETSSDDPEGGEEGEEEAGQEVVWRKGINCVFKSVLYPQETPLKT